MDLIYQRVHQHKLEALFLFSLLFIFLGLYLDQVVFFAVPILGIILIVLVKNIAWAYYLFFLLMPFSIEVDLPGGLATDFPTEQLMWFLTVFGTLAFLFKADQSSISKFASPITITLVLHILWIGISIVSSTHWVISLKWFLAKLWYIIPFYFGAYYFIPNYEKFIKILQLTFWPLLGVVIWILFRHYGHSFSFETSNIVVYPIFRNHVNSASTMVLFLPFVWLLFQTTQKQLLKWVYGFALLVFIMGIYFSYTRVAILCLPIALAMYFIVRYTLIKWALIAATIFFGTVIYFVATNNRYVNFAPNFEKTISHTEFDNLLEATYKLEDISTMERVYRWVAGAHMLKERPLLGFGPATFYTNYKDYTVRIFETYVSNNPDQSGIHSYYLMTAVEQGLVGLIILLTMIAVILLIGEKVYHQCTNTLAKNSIAACIVSIVIILVINLINDTLEVDKIGPYFFTAMAIIGMEYGRQQQSK